MTIQTFDAVRARLDRNPRLGRRYAHGDFYRDVVQRTPRPLKVEFWPRLRGSR